MANLLQNAGAELATPPPTLANNASIGSIVANTGSRSFSIPQARTTILGSPFLRQGSVFWPNLPLVVGLEYSTAFYVYLASGYTGTPRIRVFFDSGDGSAVQVGEYFAADVTVGGWKQIEIDPIEAVGSWGSLQISAPLPGSGTVASWSVDDVVCGATMAVAVSGTTYSPSNRTFSSLKTEVARYILASNDTEALSQAGEGLNEAARQLSSRMWNWMLAYYDVPLVASTSDYDLPISFKDVRHIERIDSNGKVAGRLGFKDHKSFLSDHTYSQADGTPTVASVLNANNLNQLTLNYAPTSSFVAAYPYFRVWYYGRVQLAENDSDTYAVPSEVENFMLWSAKAYLSSSRAPERFALAEGKAQASWRALIRDDVQRGHNDWTEYSYGAYYE